MILCMIGGTELILICAVVLLVFGGKKLPELMKGMGQGIRSFKEGMNDPGVTIDSRQKTLEATEDSPNLESEEK